jgi:hypothetical protein
LISMCMYYVIYEAAIALRNIIKHALQLKRNIWCNLSKSFIG